MTKWHNNWPYNDLPKLPPAGDWETKPVLKACVAARAGLAELKQAAELIPNQGILINTLPLLEAQASSEIENIVTTADELFRQAEDSRNADPATREALRYRSALMGGFENLKQRPLSTSTAEKVCSEIKGVEMKVRKVPGTALTNASTGKVVYTPPEGERLLRDLLANWERYLHRADGPDPLVTLAIAHYQFEAIHPFTDGNGRTGRILNSLFLVESGLLTLPVLYLSRYIIAHKSEYYGLLLRVTSHQDWEPWLLFMINGVAETATWTNTKIKAVRSLQEITSAYVKQRLPRIYSRELLDAIFEQPYCRIANLVRANVAQRQTASEYLKALVGVGVLEEIKSGRDKLFLHPRLLQLLIRDSNKVKPLP